MKPNSRKETNAMGNRLLLAVLLGLLLFTATGFAAWQYANVFNVVRPNESGAPVWVPSWYSPAYTTVSSFTPVTPNLRTAWMYNDDETDEIPVPRSHEQVVLRMDLLAETDNVHLRGVTITLVGNSDFDPNFDLAPIHANDVRALYCNDELVRDDELDDYTGIQFYVEKGRLAGSDIDMLDEDDLMDHASPILREDYHVQIIDPTVPSDVPGLFEAPALWPGTWEDITAGDWVAEGRSLPHPSWRAWRAEINFRTPIYVKTEAGIHESYGLPFVRVWVLLKPMGCHACQEGFFGGDIEGLSERDTFYVEISEPEHIHGIRMLGSHTEGRPNVEVIPPALFGNPQIVRWDNPRPGDPARERWSKSEMLLGGDQTDPFIVDLVPANLNPTNGPFSDQGGVVGCDEVSTTIWTADSTQPIMFTAYDMSTCIDSALVEIRHINPGIPSQFPARIDSIAFRSSLTEPEGLNSGPGAPWQVRVRRHGAVGWTAWQDVDPFGAGHPQFDVRSGVCVDDQCGLNRFLIDIAHDYDDANASHLRPFIDGAHVQVYVEVWNRNYSIDPMISHPLWARAMPFHMQDTTWDFFVDLSGPMAQLACPGTTNDNLTEEFRGGPPGWRQDIIDGETTDWRFIADSLPLVRLRLMDNYSRVHDPINHGDPPPFWTGARGGSGINTRDFEFEFVLYRLDCVNSDPVDGPVYEEYIFVVNQNDLNLGVWFDEDDDGMAGDLWINFEELFTYRTDLTGDILLGEPIIPFQSGDIFELWCTRLFDDPDYGQGSQRVAAHGFFDTDIADLIMSEGAGSYGPDGGADPNYGTRHRRATIMGWDGHIPVDEQAAAVYGVDAEPDHLGTIRIDLKGPIAPDQFYYPPKGWVTSDTLQVITVDLYDQIGCMALDTIYGFRPDQTDWRDQLVAGVYSGITDPNKIIHINIVVKDAQGRHHPDYVEFADRPWEGRNWFLPGWTTNCATQPHHIEKINNRWGARLTFAPRQHAAFRSSDRVSVTVYAWDNAITDCPAWPAFPYDEIFEQDLLCSDGSVFKTVRNYMPGRNESNDEWLREPVLIRNRSEIARFSFYVDITPPKFVSSKIYPLCDDTLYFHIRDTSAVVNHTFGDQYLAGIGAADLKLTVTDDDELGSTDFIFFNDLVPAVPFGAVQQGFLDNILPGFRDDRYMYARMDFGPNPARDGIIKVWKDCEPQSCHVLEPNDTVVVDIWAGDNPNTPWYAASHRPFSAIGYHAQNYPVPPFDPNGHYVWWHYYNSLFPLSDGDDYWMSPCAAWRRGNHSYVDRNHTSDGIGWVNHVYYNWENPTWEHIHNEQFVVQSEIWLEQVQWFNDSSWVRYRSWPPENFRYPPDLHGRYTKLWELPDGAPETMMSEMDALDPYLGDFARDLQFIEIEIYTCTDSIIWEAFWESSAHEDTITWRTPRVDLALYDDDDNLLWQYIHHVDYDRLGDDHASPLFLEYENTRDCCKDGGIVRIGPIRMIHHWLENPRFENVLESQLPNLHPDHQLEAYLVVDDAGEPILDPDTDERQYNIYGYMHGDRLEVNFGFASRTPNMFADPTDIHNWFDYRWQYNIDMQPPTARFRRLEGTMAYERVACEMMHADNNHIRIRLEDINDGAGVGLHPGGTDPNWDGTYPIPILVEGTDLVKYLWGTSADEPAGLTYATATHYIYQNERHVVRNCAEGINVARTRSFVTPITMYSGNDYTDYPIGVPIETTFEEDTLWISDSLYVEAVIQDRLGNERWLRSNNLALDNELPNVKGFAFATYDTELDMFNNWDESLFLGPWTVPVEDTLVGVYNFGTACTVYIRIWFDDNMDMRLADAHTGHIVRFQPEGWTHWFPVIPIETDIHSSLGMYPLAQRYVNYNYTDAGALSRALETTEVTSEILEVSDAEMLDDGWNSDREWIGYFVIAGDDMMDGIGKIRVQGFDDIAGNVMLARDFNFRIHSQYEEPCMIWPEMDVFDTEPVDDWSGFRDDQLVVTGWSTGTDYCSFEPHGHCWPVVSGCFDRTITDSVVFDFWWSDEMLEEGDLEVIVDSVEVEPGVWDYITEEVAPDFSYPEGDMRSPNIWTEDGGESWFARVPCDIIDILTEWYEAGSIRTGNYEKYLTIRFRAYSRYYPERYVQDFTWNLFVDNEGTHPEMTLIGGGEIPPGHALHVIPSVTERTRICITSEDIESIDYVNIHYRDMITDEIYGITQTDPPYDNEFLRVSVPPAPMIYDPVNDVICYEWETPAGIPPGLYSICVYGHDEISVVHGYDWDTGTITGRNTYMHTFCYCRDSILVPNEAFLARGDHYGDAILRVCDNYPGIADCAEIYPWDIASFYPDWPAWMHVDSTIVPGYDHVRRFQVTTYTDPDWSVADPFERSYIETGGYLGDSLFVMFRKMDALYVDMNISAIDGGDISGANLEINLRLDDAWVRDYHGEDYYVFPWTVYDQENRYDGPVRVTFTTYRENYAGAIISTDHITFILLDTADPEYNVALNRTSGVALRTCVSDDYPLEEAIWVTNAGDVIVNVDWLQTVYDGAPTPLGYVSYDEYVRSRVWDHLRLTIDGQPHLGYHTEDPNDVFQARFWQRNIAGPVGVLTPYWLSPIVLGDIYTEFGDDRYRYEWRVSTDTRGQGIAEILVKGRDAAGNLLTYDGARLSKSYGKLVLIDVEAPTVDPDLIRLTAEEMVADAEAFDDNFMGEGFRDPISGGYVFVEIWDLDMTVMLAGPDIWVNDDGSVDPSLVSLISGDFVNVCAVDLAGNRTCVEVEVQPHVEVCVYHLFPGFNMIGISVLPEDPDDLLVERVFPGLDVYTLEGGVYTRVDPGTRLTNDRGYLVMSEVERIITLAGDPVEAIEAEGLLPGWNLIGGPWTTVRTTDAGVYPAGAIDLGAVHVYDGETGSYIPTVEFAHCRGHLVMVTTMDTVSVFIPDTAIGSKTVYTRKDELHAELWNGIIDVEFRGTKTRLTFGVADGATRGVDANDIPLFPALPGQDAAYLDNNLAKSVVGNDYQVEWDLVLTNGGIITVDVSDIPERWTVSINGTDLREVRSLRLEAGVHKITAEIAELPTTFELAQNTPNPFNPITSINYSVPSESHVRIEIFNVLGESVITLVDEVQSAGSRTVQWTGVDDEGNGVTSGVYFYRMTAGGYSQTRQMTFVK